MHSALTTADDEGHEWTWRQMSEYFLRYCTEGVSVRGQSGNAIAEEETTGRAEPTGLLL